MLYMGICYICYMVYPRNVWRRSRRGSRVALSFRLPTFRKLILASLVLSCAINRLIGLIKKALYQKQIKCNLIV